MNTITEIQKQIDAMPTMMSEKGVVGPCADFLIRSDAALEVWLKCSTSTGHQIGSHGFEYFRGDTPQEAIEKAIAHIRAIPDPETAALHRYMDKLGKVVDEGRADGIPDEYTQPVSLTIKAMSDNLLSAPEASS